MNPVTKKITLNLVGLDGNAFAILGAFHVGANKERWTEATSVNYQHLLATISNHCDAPDNGHPL